MKRIFLWGEYQGNSGVCNVNRAIIEASDRVLCYPKCKNPYLRKLEIILKVCCSDIVLLSGVCSPSALKVLRLLRKKMIYLMHGNVAYEQEINHSGRVQATLEAEMQNFEYAKKIVCVSKVYSEWVKKRYPQYANKICFVNNGVDIEPREKKSKEPYSIAVGGGNRRIKNNDYVCQAVEKLNREQEKYKLYIFGYRYEGNEEIFNYPFVTYMGQMDEKEYYENLDKIKLFVVDSEVEPFGLVVADALNCRCSLLLSENVGAGSLMKMTQTDMIQDIHNTDEIATKIKYLLEHENADRLLSSVDFQACSKKQAYINLKKVCEGVCQNK